MTFTNELKPYIELYSRNRKHLTNAYNVEYTLNRRVKDFDTSSFTGKLDIAPTEDPFIFVLYVDEKIHYSGYVKNYTLDAALNLSFNGVDFREVFDTDIMLDFSNLTALQEVDAFRLDKMIEAICSQINIGAELIQQIDITIPAAEVYTNIFGDLKGQVLVENAWQFLKPYLSYAWAGSVKTFDTSPIWKKGNIVAHYDKNYRCKVSSTEFGGAFNPAEWEEVGSLEFYVRAYYDVVTQEIKIDFPEAPKERLSLNLEDFETDFTIQEPKINKAVATINYETMLDGYAWKISNPALWSISGQSMIGYNYEPGGFVLPPITEDENGLLSFVFRGQTYESREGLVWMFIEYGAPSGVPTAIFYETAKDYRKRPQEIAKIDYYLGRDGNIYQNRIPLEQKLLPERTSIFINDFLAKSQFDAVSELVNNRYNNNMLFKFDDDLTNPYDFKDFILNSKVDIYKDKKLYITLPISELNSSLKKGFNKKEVKLGFKKQLLTEIIKGGK